MTLAELQKILRAADPAAVLVSARILERVIREDCHLPNMYWNIPHAKSYVCDRQALFRHAEQADLELEPDQLLPDTVILLARPDPEELSNIERKQVLLKFWRRLFHSRIHIALGALDSHGPLTPDAVRERISEIGRTEFEEIRNVLDEDRYLPPDPDDRTTFIEFAAVYLELRFFAAQLLPNYFPGIRDFGRIEQLLARDVDAAELFVSTRLSEAPDPIMMTDTRSDESQEAYWKLVRSAQGAALSGNTVGAAILRMRASRIAPAAQTLPTRNEAEADIAHLSKRLAEALTLKESEASDWTRHLTLLLDKADQGARPTEAKVLEDLQRVCLDHEKDVYTLDLVEYVMSAGKRPIKRPLPSQRLVRITKHLRNAGQKLGEVRLSDADRNHLARLVQSSLHKSEEGLRARFGPVLVTALKDVGLKPEGPIERVAFDKMVAELLDRITSYGFLTIAELRDTISRNQFKLHDLNEPEDFIRGDPLIRLDRRLAALLDGVYRPSEFYTRWLERGTSLLFGTWWGRGFSRYFLFPLLCAWGVLHVLGLVLNYLFSYQKFPLISWVAQVLLGPLHHPPAPPPADVAGSVAILGQPETRLLQAVSVMTAMLGPIPPTPHWLWHVGLLLPVAIFAMALMQSRDFRWRCLRGLVAVRQGLMVLWALPLRVVPLAELNRLLHTWVFQLLYWYIIKPGLVAGLLCLLVPPLARHPMGVVAAYGLAAFLLNSRLGRATSEGVSDAMVRLGSMVREGLIPRTIHFFLHLFKQGVEFVEYLLFLVDEWLRFRSGDSRVSLIVRTILGVVWYPFAFFARFYMVVLIEPMINPIKLPMSVLAAKIVYPLLITMGWIAWARQLDSNVAYVVVVITLWLLPDAVAFLVWEMKENWGLYRANRGKSLEPVIVGAHGETVRGLLQPGLHSGTVPNLYAKLRIAERLATKTRNWHTARAYRHEVEAVAGTPAQFRRPCEMVALLEQSHCWKGHHVEAGRGLPGDQPIFGSNPESIATIRCSQWRSRSSTATAGWWRGCAYTVGSTRSATTSCSPSALAWLACTSAPTSIWSASRSRESWARSSRSS